MLPTIDDPRDREPTWSITINGEMVNGYVFNWYDGEYYAVWFVDGWRAPFTTSSIQSDIQSDKALALDDYFRIFYHATGRAREGLFKVVRDERPAIPSGAYTPEQIAAICATAKPLPVVESKPCQPSKAASMFSPRWLTSQAVRLRRSAFCWLTRLRNTKRG